MADEFKPLVAGLADAFEHIATPVEGNESPIEHWLGSALALYFSRIAPRHGATFAIGKPGSNDRPAHFVLIPQYPLRDYRYDFALAISGEPRPILLIECDSKQFHSSAEEIENDANKTSAASIAEIKLIRIKGGEIYHRVEKSLQSVIHDFVLECHKRAKKDFRWLEEDLRSAR